MKTLLEVAKLIRWKLTGYIALFAVMSIWFPAWLMASLFVSAAVGCYDGAVAGYRYRAHLGNPYKLSSRRYPLTPGSWRDRLDGLNIWLDEKAK